MSPQAKPLMEICESDVSVPHAGFHVPAVPSSLSLMDRGVSRCGCSHQVGCSCLDKVSGVINKCFGDLQFLVEEFEKLEVMVTPEALTAPGEEAKAKLNRLRFFIKHVRNTMGRLVAARNGQDPLSMEQLSLLEEHITTSILPTKSRLLVQLNNARLPLPVREAQSGSISNAGSNHSSTSCTSGGSADDFDQAMTDSGSTSTLGGTSHEGDSSRLGSSCSASKGAVALPDTAGLEDTLDIEDHTQEVTVEEADEVGCDIGLDLDEDSCGLQLDCDSFGAGGSIGYHNHFTHDYLTSGCHEELGLLSQLQAEGVFATDQPAVFFPSPASHGAAGVLPSAPVSEGNCHPPLPCGTMAPTPDRPAAGGVPTTGRPLQKEPELNAEPPPSQQVITAVKPEPVSKPLPQGPAGPPRPTLAPDRPTPCPQGNDVDANVDNSKDHREAKCPAGAGVLRTGSLGAATSSPNPFPHPCPARAVVAHTPGPVAGVVPVTPTTVSMPIPRAAQSLSTAASGMLLGHVQGASLAQCSSAGVVAKDVSYTGSNLGAGIGVGIGPGGGPGGGGISGRQGAESTSEARPQLFRYGSGMGLGLGSRPTKRKRSSLIPPVLSQPREVRYQCGSCGETYLSAVVGNPWWRLVSQNCPLCKKKQIPRVDIFNPTNNVEGHLSILAEGCTEGCSDEDCRHRGGNEWDEETSDESDSECEREEEDGAGGSSTGTAISGGIIPCGEGSQASTNTQTRLDSSQAAKLLVLMCHARDCPGNHKCPRLADVCRSVKFLMLHLRDCDGRTREGDPCPHRWCRPCSSLLYHLIQCTEPEKCQVCNPLNLPSPLQQLRALNHRASTNSIPPVELTASANIGGGTAPSPAHNASPGTTQTQVQNIFPCSSHPGED